MRLQPVDFAVVKTLIPITEALAVMGWRRRRQRGRSHLGPCLIHSVPWSRSEALRVSGQVWYCERCRKGGDVIRLWALTHQLDDLHAALDLCAVFGLQVPRLS